MPPTASTTPPGQGPPLSGRAIMDQWWRDITFLHWPVDPARVAPLLPRGVRPDLYDGAARVGLIPFRMVDAGAGSGHPVPWLGTFRELHDELVTAAGLPGVATTAPASVLHSPGVRTRFGMPQRL